MRSSHAGITVHDITKDVKSFLATLSHPSGTITVTSQHTTTAVTINEHEPRLIDDLRLWLSRQAPTSDMYLHNDLDQREAPGAHILVRKLACERFQDREHMSWTPAC